VEFALSFDRFFDRLRMSGDERLAMADKQSIFWAVVGQKLSC